jgi:hypothetical protein
VSQEIRGIHLANPRLVNKHQTGQLENNLL